MWTEYLYSLSEPELIAKSATTKNILSVYSASMAILFGLGTGNINCAIYSYCGIISESGSSGKNFGFLFMVFALKGFFMNAIDNG